MRAPAILAVLVSLALAGCSASAQKSPSPMPPPTPSVSASPSVILTKPETCAGFLRLSVDAQDGYFDWTVTQYTASGVKTPIMAEVLRKECSRTPAAKIDEVTYEGESPTCKDFSALGAKPKAQWLGALNEDWHVKPAASAEEVTQACALGLGTDMWNVFSWLTDSRSHPAWVVETKLGYRLQSVVDVSEVMSGDEVKHPDVISEDFVAGSACGWDPDHDAAVPFAIQTTNVTGESMPTPMARIALDMVNTSTDAITDAYLELNYSDGPTCSDATGPFKPAESGMQWSDPVDDGVLRSTRGFVILKNYFSPRNPDGATDDLKKYQLRGVAPYNESDPMKVIISNARNLLPSP